jgi:hypothetical protein
VSLNVTRLLLVDKSFSTNKKKINDKPPHSSFENHQRRERDHNIYNLIEEEEEEANHESLFIHGPSRKGKSLNV